MRSTRGAYYTTVMPSDICLSSQERGVSSSSSPCQTTGVEETADSRPGTARFSSSKHSSQASLACDSLPHEYHSGYGYAEQELTTVAPSRSSAPSPLTGPSSRPSSLTSFLPASIRARLQSVEARSPPEQQQAVSNEGDDMMGFTGEGRKSRRELVESQGTTNMSQQTPTQTASEGCASPETTPKSLNRSSTAGPSNTTMPKNAPAAAAAAPTRMSLLSMFSRTAPAPISEQEHEELLHMSVEEALFPTGPQGNNNNNKDAFSPAAFKNLQTQATGLLTKLQTAYRQKSQALSELKKEREADRDELEEAETRATHLKFQLEDMAHKAAEQEARMKQLMEELASERRSRGELEKSAFVKQRLSPGGLHSEAGSTISEDLEVDNQEIQKRKWRKSNGTDTSFETDDDSISFEGDSVFSRPRSPSVSTTTTTRGVDTASIIDMPMTTPSSVRGSMYSAKRTSVQSIQSNRRSTQQMSTFQKLMKGISGDGSDGCRNCKGQDASIAWDTVGLLRDENKNLKQRVGELEDCLEGALDVVNGIGL